MHADGMLNINLEKKLKHNYCFCAELLEVHNRTLTLQSTAISECSHASLEFQQNHYGYIQLSPASISTCIYAPFFAG